MWKVGEVEIGDLGGDSRTVRVVVGGGGEGGDNQVCGCMMWFEQEGGEGRRRQHQQQQQCQQHEAHIMAVMPAAASADIEENALSVCRREPSSVLAGPGA